MATPKTHLKSALPPSPQMFTSSSLTSCMPPHAGPRRRCRSPASRLLVLFVRCRLLLALQLGLLCHSDDFSSAALKQHHVAQHIIQPTYPSSTYLRTYPRTDLSQSPTQPHYSYLHPPSPSTVQSYPAHMSPPAAVSIPHFLLPCPSLLLLVFPSTLHRASISSPSFPALSHVQTKKFF
ncbi:hypothetical protein B0H21DRAFT_238884 [Amylocystis lapponica]|nr:hypothetical protein B0H21DRAFT_238884 [Amylocystis lapponica]